jgi:magnesium-transporting ATPase (P-type)
MRKPKSVFVDVLGTTQEFQILNVCEFNSTRKRMSTVIRGPDGRIKLYCKGADTVIVERLAPSQLYTEKTIAHLEVRSVLPQQLPHTEQTEFRTTPPKVYARSALHTVIYLSQSISSGPQSTIRQPQLLMVEARRWTRPLNSSRRTCSY